MHSCALQVAVEQKARKTKNFTRDIIAGLIDCAHLRTLEKGQQGQKVQLYTTLVYWDRHNKLCSDYPRLRVREAYSFKAGQLHVLFGSPPSPENPGSPSNPGNPGTPVQA